MDYTLAEVETLIRTDPVGIVNQPDMLASVRNCRMFVEGIQSYQQKYKAAATVRLVNNRATEPEPEPSRVDIDYAPCEVVMADSNEQVAGEVA